MGNKLADNLMKGEEIVVEGKLHFLTILPWHFIRYATTRLSFTNKRVVGHIGFIKSKTLDAPLNKINNVSVSSGLFGKIFGYGRVTINTSSGTFKFHGIKKANEFKSKLLAQMDQFEEDRINLQAEKMAQAIKG